MKPSLLSPATPADAPALLALHVNGEARHTWAAPDTSLLHVLRNDFELNGPKYGCGLGECGACTVLVDGVAARACVIPVRGVVGRRVTTLEGLGAPARPGPTQRAFIECQAAQCGYCLNGMIVTIEALLRRCPEPTEAQLRSELQHNLCRCGTHVEILQAARRAVELHRQVRDADADAAPGPCATGACAASPDS